MTTARKPYPSDVSDDEWALVAPYVTLLRESAGQRQHPLRELFNGLRHVARCGVAWRAMPNDLPPLAGPGPRCSAGGSLACGSRWHAVYDQAQRWLRVGCLEMLAQDLRAVLRLAAGRAAEPSAAVLDSRTLRSTPESGHRAGWDGHKRTRGSKLHLAVDTLGHLLALRVTPATEGDRAAVAELAEAVQDATGESVELAFVDQGYTGERAAEAAQAHGVRLEVVKLPEAKRGFVLLPRRPPWPPGHGPCGDGAGACCAGWVVERSFAWAARCRRLARDHERLPETLAGLHVVAFACTCSDKQPPSPRSITASKRNGASDQTQAAGGRHLFQSPHPWCNADSWYCRMSAPCFDVVRACTRWPLPRCRLDMFPPRTNSSAVPARRTARTRARCSAPGRRGDGVDRCWGAAPTQSVGTSSDPTPPCCDARSRPAAHD